MRDNDPKILRQVTNKHIVLVNTKLCKKTIYTMDQNKKSSKTIKFSSHIILDLSLKLFDSYNSIKNC